MRMGDRRVLPCCSFPRLGAVGLTGLKGIKAHGAGARRSAIESGDAGAHACVCMCVTIGGT
jgi:hypothetical protein